MKCELLFVREIYVEIYKMYNELCRLLFFLFYVAVCVWFKFSIIYEEV